MNEKLCLSNNDNVCQGAPFYLPLSSVISLINPTGWLDGEVIDACFLTNSGIQRAIYQYVFVLPNRFLTDANLENFVQWLPHKSRYNTCDFVVTAAHHSNHWCFAVFDNINLSIIYTCI